MSFGPQQVTYSLWALSLIELATICVCMARNGSRRDFPIFFYFSGFTLMKSVSLLVLQRGDSYREYFYAYWTLNLLTSCFGIAVIREVFLASFKAIPGLREFGKLAFSWAATLMLLLTVVIGLNAHSGYMHAATTAVFNLESSVNVMQVGLLLLLFVGSEQLGLAVRSRTFGIALGMGIAASTNLIFVSVYSQFAFGHEFGLTTARSAAFVGSCALWLGYLALPAIEAKPVPLPVASPLSRWNEAAMAFGYKGAKVLYGAQSPEPFMPQVERIVSQVIDKQRSR